MNTVPDRLRINNRQPDNEFDDNAEDLYRRVPSEYWPIRSDTLPILLSIPLSVARGRYCESPTDVLFPSYSSDGVISWTVGDIPSHVREGKAQTFLRLEHCPENDFYPHSEIRAYKSLDEVPLKKLKSKPLKAKIRQLLAQKALDRHSPSS